MCSKKQNRLRSLVDKALTALAESLSGGVSFFIEGDELASRDLTLLLNTVVLEVGLFDELSRLAVCGG